MKRVLKIAVLGSCVALVLVLDLVPLVPEAQAVAGVRRRTARRTAVVVGSAASAESAASQQQAAASQQQAAAAEQKAAAAEQEAAAANAEAAAAKQQAAAAQAAAAPRSVPPGGAVAVGTVVTVLPQGCTTTVIGGVEYQYCGGTYYRAAFQGTQLVYVAAQP